VKTLKPGDHGPRVLALQKLLVHNHTGRRFYYGALDGDFGRLTQQGCSRAKWCLGYLTCEPFAGDLLVDFLSGKHAPTAGMKARAVTRAEPRPKPPERTLQQKAFADMRAHLGEHEMPAGSNHCPDTVEWGHGDLAWCNVRVSLSYIHAGSRAFSRSAYRFQLVSAMLEDAKEGKHGLVVTHSPVHGDIVVWDYPGGSAADHTTEFNEWLDSRHTMFSDIGGNEGLSGVCKADVNNVAFVRAWIHVER